MSVINLGSVAASSAGSGTPTTVSASTTTTSVLAANSSRKRAIIHNLPSNTATVWLTLGTPATVATAIPLAPGQAWFENSGNIYTGAFTCITQSGTATLFVQEFS